MGIFLYIVAALCAVGGFLMLGKGGSPLALLTVVAPLFGFAAIIAGIGAVIRVGEQIRDRLTAIQRNGALIASRDANEPTAGGKPHPRAPSSPPERMTAEDERAYAARMRAENEERVAADTGEPISAAEYQQRMRRQSETDDFIREDRERVEAARRKKAEEGTEPLSMSEMLAIRDKNRTGG